MLYKESLMKVGYKLIVASTIFMFLACAGSSEQMKKNPEIKVDPGTESLPIKTKTPDAISIVPELADSFPIATKTPDAIPIVPDLADSFSIATKTPDAISAVPELKEPLDSVALAKIRELKQHLVMKGVPGEWFDKQFQHETFQIHSNIDRYFQKSVEKQVDHDKKRDASWYFARLDVDAKIKKGKKYIKDHSDLFQKAEARHGIHQELIAAIVGIETNFADHHQRGKFYAFNSLVSQYIFTKRMKFAIREITALYKFSQKTGHPPQYFTSSYAGAIGWGQFIPSSLLTFFIDADGVHEDADPFSLEDTIFSVENYLHEHNLSGKNINDYGARYKAVFAYNNSDIYVKAVLFIYDGLRL